MSETTPPSDPSRDIAVDLLIFADIYIGILNSIQLVYDSLWELGYDVDLEGQQGRGFTVLQKIVLVSEELSGAYQDVVDFAKRPPTKLSEWTKVLKFLGKLGETGLRIYRLAEEEGIDPEAEFGKDFFPSLGRIFAVKALEFSLPQLYHGLVLTTVIRPGSEATLTEHLRDANGKIIRFPHALTEVDFGRLGQVFDDPAQLMKDEYLSEPQPQAAPLTAVSEFEDPQLEQLSKKLFKRLRKFLVSTGANVVFGLKPADWLDFADPLTRQVNERTLSFWYEFLDEKIEVGCSLAFLRQPNGEMSLGVLPFGGFQKDFTVKDWTLQLDATQFIHPFVINGSNESGPGATQTRLAFSLAKDAPQPAADTTQSDDDEAPPDTQLELGRIAIQGGLTFFSELRDAGILVEFSNSKLVVVPEDDGFLRKVIPEKGVNINFDFGIGWSSAFGFYLKGGTGLEVEIPKHLEFAKIFTLTALQLGLHASNTELRGYTALSGKVSLGPFAATVDSIGLQAVWRFSDAPADTRDAFALDLKPPKGVGLKIDAAIGTASIRGSGYLYFDQDKGQYAGVAELAVKSSEYKIAVKAIGIITTSMPDGSEGYSFLLLVSAEWAPVQIGLGFTLNGVGGLIGYNRTMDVAALRLGLRENSLDNVLFPAKPLENAKRIISSANAIFPVQDDRCVFGLMGLFGWGAHNLVTLKLGVLIEVPDPVRLAIVGVVKAAVSKEVAGKEQTVLKLQVNFAGIIDFDRNFFSFDASLFDSTLLSFRLEGDMALRVQWGTPRCFLLSVGGFHPDFNEIPQGFPPMSRLMLPLVDRKRAQVLLTFYLAITPNTFQLGSEVFFFFKISKFNLKGGFAFDALFYSRSNFLVRITAELDISWGSRTLVGVSFKGTFTGTSPWHITGKAKIKFLFWSKTFDIDKTYGEEIDTRLQEIQLLPELTQELQDRRNWQEVTLPAARVLVTVKGEDQSAEEASPPIMLHPTGGVSVSQSVLPLAIRLDKFGSQNVAGVKRFDLQLVDGAGQVLDTVVENDLFAPAMYLNLSDEEKLSRKSYESFPAGIRMKQADHLTVGSFKEKPVRYESKVFDGVETPLKTTVQVEDATLFDFLSKGNTTAQSEVGSTLRFAQLAGASHVSLPAEDYVLVSTRDLTPYTDWARRPSQTEALQLLEDILAEKPELEAQLAVVPAYEIE